MRGEVVINGETFRALTALRTYFRCAACDRMIQGLEDEDRCDPCAYGPYKLNRQRHHRVRGARWYATARDIANGVIVAPAPTTTWGGGPLDTIAQQLAADAAGWIEG